jgi:hypothetical protein
MRPSATENVESRDKVERALFENSRQHLQTPLKTGVDNYLS